jgi:hypothetical protein
MGAAAPVAAVASIASAGLTAYGQYAGGQAKNAADIYQSQRLDRAAEYGRVAAVQTNVQGVEKLDITLGNIDAVRAAGNIDPSSPTTEAIRERTSYLSERDTNIKVGNILAQTQQDEADAAYLRKAGAFALTAGKIGAAATLLKGLSGGGGGGGGGGGIPYAPDDI